MLISLLLTLVRVVFLDPLVQVLPVFQAGWHATELGGYVANINAVFPVYWPLFLIGLLVQTALLLLPLMIGVWLWRVAKP